MKVSEVLEKANRGEGLTVEEIKIYNAKWYTNKSKYIIIDEYNTEFTLDEFLREVNLK